VYGNAQVYGNAWDHSPLYIQGTRHSLTFCKFGWLQIGCHGKLVTWWLENYKEVGVKEGYTPEQIEEYGQYIELFAKRPEAKINEKA
jgi:hypothetical protein